MDQSTFGPEDVLGIALTAQGLLLAALGLAVAVRTQRRLGEEPPGWPATLVAGTATVIVILGMGGTSAWIDLLGDPNWPDSCLEMIEAVSLLVALIALPVVAVIVGIRARPPR